MSNDPKKIGERLQLAREKAGFLTAAEAAEALGMKYSTYAGHENGSRGVVRSAEKYARRFRVSLDWLLRGKGPGPGEKNRLQEVFDRLAEAPEQLQERILGYAEYELDRYEASSRDTTTTPEEIST